MDREEGWSGGKERSAAGGKVPVRGGRARLRGRPSGSEERRAQRRRCGARASQSEADEDGLHGHPDAWIGLDLRALVTPRSYPLI
jgi:hypothetical protein